MLFYLYINTKNFQSLKKFSKTFFKIFFYNSIKKLKYYPLIKKRTRFSILKSPHVNKTSQEQFEFRKSYRKIKLYTPYYLKSFFLLNLLYNRFFSSDINIKIVFLLKKINKQTVHLLKNTKNFCRKLKVLDTIGETLLKQKLC
mgnify:CR=1 FL=1